MYTCVHIYGYMHTYMHTYMRTNMHTFTCACVHTCMHACMRAWGPCGLLWVWGRVGFVGFVGCGAIKQKNLPVGSCGGSRKFFAARQKFINSQHVSAAKRVHACSIFCRQEL